MSICSACWSKNEAKVTNKPFDYFAFDVSSIVSSFSNSELFKAAFRDVI